MKQLMRVLLVMVLVLTMVAPAFAAPTEGFVKSINAKPDADLLPLGTCEEHGEEVYGWLIDEEGNKHCLCDKYIVVTPLYEFQQGTQHPNLPQEVIDLIFEVFETVHSDLEDVHGLVERIKAELGKLADEDHVAVYELYDITVLDRKTGEVFEIPDGHKLQVRLDVSIAVEKFLEIMSYAEDHWQLAEKVVNTGTYIDVTFDHLCPVALLVEVDDADIPADDEPGDEDGDKEDGEATGSEGSDGAAGGKGDTPKTGDESNPALWGGLCAVALAGLLGILKARKRA